MSRESQRRGISRIAVLEERSTRLRRDRRHEGLQGLRGRSQRNHGDVIVPVRLHVRLILLGGRRMSVHLDFGGRWDWARRGSIKFGLGLDFVNERLVRLKLKLGFEPGIPLRLGERFDSGFAFHRGRSHGSGGNNFGNGDGGAYTRWFGLRRSSIRDSG